MFPYQELRDLLDHDIATALSRGELTDGQCVQIQSLQHSFYKKLAPNGNTAAADAKALDSFLELNASIPDGPFVFAAESEQDSLLWDYFRDNFAKALTPGDVDFDLAYMREKMTAGPGAALGCNSDSFFTKLFNSQLTATSEYLLTLYRGATSESDTWSLAEMRRNQKFGFKVVRGNRLFFVPKNSEISRTCCTEPCINMLLQQALGAFMGDCLARSFGINLSTQPDNNRELARLGSIDGSFGTIDLRSASDSIWWSLVQRITPNNLLGFIRLFRSPTAELPDGSVIDLKMVSTMGNGFTFPLQTLIFASAVRAVYQLLGFPSRCPRTQFGVFGDDIVVRPEAYSLVVRLLTLLGFQVNANKSFNVGPFRESCGYDWHNGVFCRGVYVKSLETHQEVYSTANRLQRWSALTSVPLHKTVRFLVDWIPRHQLLLIPFSESPDGGFQTPSRWVDQGTDSRGWTVYKMHASVPKEYRVPGSPDESKHLGYEHFNAYGWEVCFLGGYARTNEWSIRPTSYDTEGRRRGEILRPTISGRRKSGLTRYKVVRKSIPFWDWSGPVHRPRSTKGSTYEKVDPWFDRVRPVCSVAAWVAVATVP